MSLKILLGLFATITLVKSLFFGSSVQAQDSESKPFVSPTNLSSLPQFVSPTNLSSLPQADSQPSKLFITQDQPDSGSPSLRRQPVEGEQRFEPTRIPLRLPRRSSYRVSPSITIINPSGFGAAWGSAGIGVGLQQRVRFRDQADGVVGFGFGLGNPQKNIGLQIGISLVDVSAPYRDGAVSFKLHRRLPRDFSVAVGTQGAIIWGNTDGGSSVYGAVSKRFALRPDRTRPLSEMYMTLGVGGGQFRSESDVENEIESVGVFGSVAVRVIEPISLISEWSGQDLTFGVSIVPFRNLPVVIVPAVTDITGQAGDGARFIFGVGYSFSF